MIVLSSPQDVSLSTTAAWTDIDLSGISGYTSSVVGAVIEVVNTGTANRAFGLRKNGSTDNRTNSIIGVSNGKHFWAAIGVDSSGILEGYIAHDEVDFYVHALFTNADAAFFTNAVDKSTGTTGSWTDLDVSSDTGGATATLGFFEYVALGNRNVWMRQNGSTDDRRSFTIGQHAWIAVGFDGSEIAEQWISVSDADAHFVGYMTANATWHTNATDRSTATTGSYEDIAALPSGAIMGLYEMYNAGGAAQQYHVRIKGNSDDRYYNVNRHESIIVGLDGSRVAQQKIANSDADLYQNGYISSGGGGGGPTAFPWMYYQRMQWDY